MQRSIKGKTFHSLFWLMDKAQSEVKFPERENKAENLSVEPMRNHDTMDAQTGSQETPPH